MERRRRISARVAAAAGKGWGEARPHRQPDSIPTKQITRDVKGRAEEECVPVRVCDK